MTDHIAEGVGVREDERRYMLSQVLYKEFESLRPGFFANASSWESRDEKKKCQEAYKIAQNLRLSALALSGGGIRSASVALGVIQALAEAKLLREFDYLSTVSGGGYIGSWLSAWLYWNKKAGAKAEAVLKALTMRSDDPDKEPTPIQHLRAYSSYLTPKLGFTSADTWAAVTLVVRNLLLNWLILVPAICLVVLSIKVAAGLLHTAVFDTAHITSIPVALVLLLLAGCSLGYKLQCLYPANAADQSPNATKGKPSAKYEQSRFLRLSVLPAIVAGICFAWLVNSWFPPRSLSALPPYLSSQPENWLAAPGMIVVAIVILFIAVVVLRSKNRVRLRLVSWDFAGWIFAAATAGTAIWLGVHLYSTTEEAAGADLQRVLFVFGLPWFMLSMLMGQLAYVLARSYSKHGDFEREWLARAGGWFIIVTLAWILLSALVLLGAELTNGLEKGAIGAKRWLAALGGVGTLSGIATAFLGKSSNTPARGQATSLRGTIANVALAIAGPVFAAILLILLSALLDIWVLGQPLSSAAILTSPEPHGGSYAGEWGSMLKAVAALIAIVLAADFLVNVNRFSLHATYRNRLIRAFLGGPHSFPVNANPPRKADGFTDFDPGDNLRMRDLWDGPVADGDWRPFHVINAALNLAATTNLAWQQRKAESFVITPQFCGCATLGYRDTGEYGDPGNNGISVGTAMAISGAAVSPNMGYHSSPSIAFLLTLLNVRLGWWLGNPGRGGGQNGRPAAFVKRMITRNGAKQALAPYRQDAPWLSLLPLLTELFGLTGADSRYVYLSDGGHFENLGIYEMVRRRCRWIILSDADADPDRGFADLGNAVRKIWIDLGVRITFEESDLLRASGDTSAIDVPYCALGTIEYLNDEDGRVTGKILYIKPVVRGTEPAADVIAYVRAHKDFPHQSTAEQWFDEPQLESYRVLGYWMTKRIVDSAKLVGAVDTLEHFFASLEVLDFKTLSRSRSLGFVTG